MNPLGSRSSFTDVSPPRLFALALHFSPLSGLYSKVVEVIMDGQSAPTLYPSTSTREEATVYSLTLEDNGSPSQAKTVRRFVARRVFACNYTQHVLCLTARTLAASARTLHLSDSARGRHDGVSQRHLVHQLPFGRVRLCSRQMARDNVSSSLRTRCRPASRGLFLARDLGRRSNGRRHGN